MCAITLKTLPKSISLPLLCTSFLILAGCSAPHKPAEWQKMTLISGGPSSSVVEVRDLDGTGGHGEQMFFESDLTDQAGNKAGQVIGMTVIAHIGSEDGAGNAKFEERFSTLAFVFDDGDEIMALGSFVYPEGATHLQGNVPQMRAIIGGTGKYKGIRGQMTTTRNADGKYILELEYRME